MIRKASIQKNEPAFIPLIAQLLLTEFQANVKDVDSALTPFQRFINALEDDLWVFIETDYVDKVYRDSYYKFYASKAKHYVKNCIKLSFFHSLTEPLPNELDSNSIVHYQDHYGGFLILRPTLPSLIGRNAISPKILKQKGIVSCLSTINATVDDLKFTLNAFPASSQDGETISCAETTIWSLMEYYGNKYSEYRPTLPSNIIQTLEDTLVERQLPSAGLTPDNLSYLAKRFGFGPRIYHRDGFKETTYNILSCFIESGIPIMVALGNNAYVMKNGGKYIGHAVLCIGHEEITEAHLNTLPTKAKDLNNGISLLDYDDIEKRFLFNDDNFPPYQLDRLDVPTGRYTHKFGKTDWDNCIIEHFVVPLHKKIYIEPFVVKQIVHKLLESTYFSELHNSQVAIRTYLCSTRSYRDYVKRSDMTIEMKREIGSIFLPKFIWVTEISTLDLLKQNKANSLLIIDATESKKENYAPIILGLHNNKALIKDIRGLAEKNIQTIEYTIYKDNLKTC